jgi:hypothetical protein
MKKVVSGPHWKRLGFLTSEPRDEFGSCQFALDQMKFLAVNRSTRIKRLVKQAEDLGYPFFSSCISITRMILNFFDLYDADRSSFPGSPDDPVVLRARPAQLKHFLELCRNCADEGGGHTVLDEFFCMLVGKNHMIWADMWAVASTDPLSKQMEKAQSSISDVMFRFWDTPKFELTDVRFVPNI